MTKRPTIKQLCHDRLVDLRAYGEATREKRIIIQCANLQIMREEIGEVPAFCPQSDAEVPDWTDKHDRTLGSLEKAIRMHPRLPGHTELPSPFTY